MKYLKLFEQYDQDEYYIEIDQNKYYDLIGYEEEDVADNKDDFIQYEVSEIEKLTGLKANFTNPEKSIIIINSDFKYSETFPPSVVICKLKDEYFLVCVVETKFGKEFSKELISQDYKYYKCDQISGVLKLLKNLKK